MRREIKEEGRRGAPCQVAPLAREIRVLMEHDVGGILALADLQHAGERLVPVRHRRARLQHAGEAVHLRVGPLAIGLLRALGSVLVDDAAHRVVEDDRSGGVAKTCLGNKIREGENLLFSLGQNLREAVLGGERLAPLRLPFATNELELDLGCAERLALLLEAMFEVLIDQLFARNL